MYKFFVAVSFTSCTQVDAVHRLHIIYQRPSNIIIQPLIATHKVDLSPLYILTAVYRQSR